MNLLLLFGPTLMIFIGLQVAGDVVITFLLFYGWLLLAPFMYNKLNRDNAIHISFPLDKKSLWTGILTGISFLILIFVTVSVLFEYVFDSGELKQLLVELGFSGPQVWLLVVVLIVINPFLEEFYWRGFMHTLLHRKTNVKNAVLLTSLFYSLYHFLSTVILFTWPFNIISCVPVFLAGIIWSYMRIKQHSIAAPIISHIFADAGIMLIYIVYFSS